MKDSDHHDSAPVGFRGRIGPQSLPACRRRRLLGCLYPVFLQSCFTLLPNWSCHLYFSSQSLPLFFTGFRASLWVFLCYPPVLCPGHKSRPLAVPCIGISPVLCPGHKNRPQDSIRPVFADFDTNVLVNGLTCVRYKLLKG